MVTAAVVVAELFGDQYDASLGGPASAVAAVLSIRGFCVQLNCNIQNAFELGRDVGRAESAQILTLYRH